MSLPLGLNFGLGSIPLLSSAQTRSISAENPDGAKSGGAKADGSTNPCSRELGTGWKVRPCITLKKGETVVLADIKGPGVIQHIWITVDTKAYASCILRMYWDGQLCVETPLGDFFACGHGLRTKIASLPVAVNPSGGFNCYWPMPFRQSAKITIENQWHEDIGGFFYQITYALTDVPAEAGCFHAQHRRSLTRREYPEHVILDGVKGQGHYVGTYLAWTQMSNGWWGEGEVKFYIDADKEFPTICGTGTEDYFGGAWCFYGPDHREEVYTTAFLGLPLSRHVDNEVPRHGLYRWHIMDPVRFQSDLRVTVQALGWWPGGKYQPLTDDIASTAYWYQTLPHGPFPKLPDINQRYSR
jgi:hypothetical protein